jgi:hypothetical protein
MTDASLFNTVPTASAMVFDNPINNAAYRLLIDAGGDGKWRITKSYQATAETRIIRHLRGFTGSGLPQQAVLDALVLGDHQTEKGVVGDPRQTFARVIIADLNGSYIILAAMARNARAVCQQGKPGFRPRCPRLKAEMDLAFERAAEGCRTLAQAWLSTGFAVEPLPQWLTDAIEDVSDLAELRCCS